MWKNYLLSAVRNVKKQPLFSLINIAGLSIGLASCLLITLFVLDELTFDQYHEHADRIYRMRVDLKIGENAFDGVIMPAPFAPTVQEAYPEVELAARFRQQGSRMVRAEGDDLNNIDEQLVTYADKEIFDLFTIPLRYGSTSKLLEPNTLAISSSCAERHFGPGINPVGKNLIISNQTPWEVVAVYEDLPQNSHFHFDLMLSMASLEEARQPVWVSHNFVTYFRLQEGADIQALEDKFPELIETYVGPQIEQFLGTSMEERRAAGDRIVYFTQPLLDIHLEPNLLGEIEPGGDIAYVYIFSAVALFLLIIACINFMNLSTARSAGRAREVGVRKALGSLKGQLTQQFLTESVLMTFCAMILAILISMVAIPYFNTLSGKSLSIPWDQPLFIPAVCAIVVLVGLVAGFYPALFLSAFKPVDVLKGKLVTGAKNGRLRGILVIVQFATSVIMIVSTIVVYQQLGYVQDRKLGYEKDQILVINDAWFLDENAQAFKNQLLAFPEVKHASYSSFIPVSGSNRNNNAFWKTGNQTQESTVILQNWEVDTDYITTLGMEIVEGRGFSPDFGTDSTSVILNETAVRQFDLGPDPLGKKISGFTSMPNPESGEAGIEDFTVIGVIKDFHFESLKDQIAALGLFLGDSRGTMLLKLNGSDVGPVMSKARAAWERMAPNFPFDYSFLDERFASMYENEHRVGKIFATFAGLAIFIACLGLFALATFLAEQKTKEIGVRKALGATNLQILTFLSSDFMKLVVAGIGLAVPIAWILMDRWLENYHYRVSLNFWSFFLAGLTAIFIALLTIGSQSWRAARTDPAISLRDE